MNLPMKYSATFGRRQFLQRASLAAAGLATTGSWTQAQTRRRAKPTEPLRIGIIGAGGRGFDNLMGVKSETIAALCDVDDDRAKTAFAKFPEARRYRDFRVMLEQEKNLDAVVVSTPDHTHAIAAIAAMKRGLHVYCEKPLAHSIYEVRQMAKTA